MTQRETEATTARVEACGWGWGTQAEPRGSRAPRAVSGSITSERTRRAVPSRSEERTSSESSATIWRSKGILNRYPNSAPSPSEERSSMIVGHGSCCSRTSDRSRSRFFFPTRSGDECIGIPTGNGGVCIVYHTTPQQQQSRTRGGRWQVQAVCGRWNKRWNKRWSKRWNKRWNKESCVDLIFISFRS